MTKENRFSKALQQVKQMETNNEINNEINKSTDFTNLFTKKKKIDKVLVNFTLKEDTYKRLITIAEKNNLTLTEVVETTLEAMLDANKVKVNEKMVESFKAKNVGRGRPRKVEKKD